jgi:hypothetical protein
MGSAKYYGSPGTEPHDASSRDYTQGKREWELCAYDL